MKNASKLTLKGRFGWFYNEHWSVVKKQTMWRNRSKFADLKKRYTHENYPAKLVGCKRLDEYDQA